MKRFLQSLAFFLAITLVAFNAQAQEDSIAFDGDFYQKISEDFDSAIQVVEYVPQRENVSNWTRKLTFRHYPHLTDARTAGALLDASIKQDPANTAEKSVARGDEALVSYLRWPENSDFMEYQIVHYLKQKDVEGLVTYQFTYRFKPLTKPGDANQIAQERQRWLGAFANSRWTLPAAFLKKP